MLMQKSLLKILYGRWLVLLIHLQHYGKQSQCLIINQLKLSHSMYRHISSSLCVGMFMCAAPPGEKAVLACRRGVSIVRVTLLTAERGPALAVSFVGGGDINVAFTQPLARTQTRAGLSEQARVILRERRRMCNILWSLKHSTRKLHIIRWELMRFPRWTVKCVGGNLCKSESIRFKRQGKGEVKKRREWQTVGLLQSLAGEREQDKLLQEGSSAEIHCSKK